VETLFACCSKGVATELAGNWKQEKQDDAFLKLAVFKARYRQREAVKHKGLLSCHNLLASPCDCAQHNEQDGNHIDTSYRNGEHPES
jgi:hypothetical protein